MRMDRRIGLWGGQSKVPIGTEWVFRDDNTFVVPETGTYQIICIGAGGSGGGGGSTYIDNNDNYCGGDGGGGGSSGCFMSSFVYLLAGDSYNINIGASYWGADPGKNGNSGNDTSFGSIIVARGGRGGEGGSSSPGSGGKSAGTGSTAGKNGSRGGYAPTAYGEASGGAGGIGGKGHSIGNLTNVGRGGDGGAGADHKSMANAGVAGSSGQNGNTGAVGLTLFSYQEIVFHTVTITSGSASTGWFTYNGTKYTSGSEDIPEGESITIAGSTRRTINIKLNGTTVASGKGASYTLNITADTTIKVSGFSTITITVTTA